jgi:hypothetical protein
MLRDSSKMDPKPFSYSRVQLVWWTIIVLSSFISIIVVTNEIPTLLDSTLILLGISAATTASARMIDNSDQAKQKTERHQDTVMRENLFLDILSDENGVSIHRFQSVAFNLTIGIWFICTVIKKLNTGGIGPDGIIPDIANNNLILIGLSSATYAALKSTENKNSPPAAPAEHVPDEANNTNSNIVG